MASSTTSAAIIAADEDSQEFKQLGPRLEVSAGTGPANGQQGDGAGIPLDQSRGALGKEFHPLANVFPLLESSDFDRLVGSVRANGLREPIVLYEDKILDGRNRDRACEVAGKEPQFVQLPDGVDPLQFVIDKNLHRRHLTESQRAMVAARLATLGHGGDRVSEQAASLPVATQAQAANLLNVGERSVRSAVAVRDNGAPELRQAVERGEVSVSAAAVVADLPKDEQKAAVREGKKGVANAASKAKAKKKLKKQEPTRQQSKPAHHKTPNFSPKEITRAISSAP